MAEWLDQDGFDVRFGWGPVDAAHLQHHVDAMVVVDVLRFTTAVDVAVSRGVVVLPCHWDAQEAAVLAAEAGAELAGPRSRWSLSPDALLAAPSGLRLVLPSPNGSTVAAGTAAGATVFAGCLRNASAVAAAAGTVGSVAVIASGERWPDGSLRPAVEDLLGAGAILTALVDAGGNPSPEARTAVAAWRDACPTLAETLRDCISGRELIDKGYERDLPLAADHDASRCVPVLQDGAFLNR